MNWLTNYVLPKIRALTRKEVPDNLWRKCPSCEQMLFHRELAANLEVCRHCGHHFRIGSEARFKILFDDGAFEKIEAPKVPQDPLRFRDRKRYTDRLREKLPEGFQRAEYLHEHGMVDQVVPRGELHGTVARILSLLREPVRGAAALPATATRKAAE